MNDETSRLERRILDASPRLDAATRDRLLFEAGAAATRRVAGRRTWTASFASALTSAAACWLVVAAPWSGGGAGPVDEPSRVVDAPRRGATNAMATHETPDAGGFDAGAGDAGEGTEPGVSGPVILTARGVFLASGADVATGAYDAGSRTTPGEASDGSVWRAGLGMRDGDF